jgi:hypothetical protein
MILFAYLDKLPAIPEALIRQQQTAYENWRAELEDRLKNNDNSTYTRWSSLSPMVQWHAAFERQLENGDIAHNINYNRWSLTTEMNQWIESNICKADSAGLQISSVRPNSDTHLCHTDSYPRRWVLNYMYTVGGENIHTRWFKEQGESLIRPPLTVPNNLTKLNLIHSTVIESHRWYLLNSSVLHDVVGITSNRESISLGIADNNPFVRIPSYQNGIELGEFSIETTE